MFFAIARLSCGFTRQQKNIVKKVKTTKNISSTYESRNDQGVLYKNFPYRFNGVRSYPEDGEEELTPYLPKEKPFEQIYKTFLEAASEKNKDQLSKVVDSSLLEPLLNQKIKFKLINKDQPLKIVYSSLLVGYGFNFDRNKGPIKIRNEQGRQKQKFRFYFHLNDEDENDLVSAFIKGRGQLMSLQTTIVSKSRLALAGDQEQREESHVVTFEAYTSSSQKRKNFLKSGLMYLLFPITSIMDGAGSMHRSLHANSGNWKIGNIDSFYKPRNQE